MNNATHLQDLTVGDLQAIIRAAVRLEVKSLVKKKEWINKAEAMNLIGCRSDDTFYRWIAKYNITDNSKRPKLYKTQDIQRHIEA